MNEKILLIEDEEKLARFIELELLYEGYKVEKAFDGRIGLDAALTGSFDIIVLDIMLPGLNGMEVLRRIRRSSSIPVIMLTARDSIVDKVTGLDGGADDYLTKPFAIEELLAGIRSALRKKVHPVVVKSLHAGGLTLDIERHLAASFAPMIPGRAKQAVRAWDFPSPNGSLTGTRELSKS